MTTTISNIGFILDGNRRWAVNKGMKKIEGHEHGFNNLHNAIRWCDELGIPNMTVYALSTENWKRAPEEVHALLALFERMLVTERDKLLEHSIRIRFIGDLSRFNKKMRIAMSEIEQQSKKHKKTLFVCLSYGGRLEIVEAAKQFALSGKKNLTEKQFEKYLWSHDMPDPELIIRTGGDHRLSNFLTWRSVYSELVFTKTLWPAFTKRELQKIVTNYLDSVRINKGK